MENLSNIPVDFSDAVLEVPCGDGSLYPFTPEGLTRAENGRLLLPLSSEYTEAGRGLVRALWFDRAVYLWTSRRRWLLRPLRCHIVGGIFTAQYRRAKARDQNAEVAAVWELEVLRREEPGVRPPVPRPLHQSCEPELHLDHPSLSKILF